MLLQSLTNYYPNLEETKQVTHTLQQSKLQQIIDLACAALYTTDGTAQMGSGRCMFIRSVVSDNACVSNTVSSDIMKYASSSSVHKRYC